MGGGGGCRKLERKSVISKCGGKEQGNTNSGGEKVTEVLAGRSAGRELRVRRERQGSKKRGTGAGQKFSEAE